MKVNLHYGNVVLTQRVDYMRQLKGSSGYLKNQVRKNLVKAVLTILIFQHNTFYSNHEGFVYIAIGIL
jgi:hypothetical protein